MCAEPQVINSENRSTHLKVGTKHTPHPAHDFHWSPPLDSITSGVSSLESNLRPNTWPAAGHMGQLSI